MFGQMNCIMEFKILQCTFFLSALLSQLMYTVYELVINISDIKIVISKVGMRA